MYPYHLTSLAALHALRVIEGELDVSSDDACLTAPDCSRATPELRSLTRLEIDDCDALRDLTGLDSLREVGLLGLEENAALQSLAGIPELRRAAHVSLAWNPALEDISALSSIDAMALTLWDLMSLADLSPLRGVTLYDVHVVKLPLIRTLDGLEGVGARPSRIDVQKNVLLEDISAIRHVQHATEVEIMYNPSLRSLDALSGLISSPHGQIDYNAQLPQCEVDALISRVPGIMGSNNDQTAT